MRAYAHTVQELPVLRNHGQGLQLQGVAKLHLRRPQSCTHCTHMRQGAIVASSAQERTLR